MTERFKDMDEVVKASLLYDFYGGLLTEKQSEVMEMYHEENLSLREIAEEQGVSRQAVYNNLKAAEKLLYEYEDKLGLVDKLFESRRIIQEIKEADTIEEVRQIVEHFEL